ncbi:hypothetical protein [Flammeovirga sp. SubArs3]|uniref:hypothetical protein n=1 Tax=Flammeovirga sp. SubArs3 TaxID=2995316 RepID=UPI00248AC553|nr:hypothetical protein [Flammeovirga sp. SubArs3]
MNTQLSESSYKEEVKIYYDSPQKLTQFYCGGLFVIIGILLTPFNSIDLIEYIFPVIVILFGAYITVKSYIQWKNINPQLLFNEEGIKLSNGEIIHWNEISIIEAIEKEGYMKGSTTFLVIEKIDGQYLELSLNDFNTTAEEVNSILYKFIRGL